MKSIEILVMVVLGGMGSMLGSILSATVLTILPELLRSVADYRMESTTHTNTRWKPENLGMRFRPAAPSVCWRRPSTPCSTGTRRQRKEAGRSEQYQQEEARHQAGAGPVYEYYPGARHQ